MTREEFVRFLEQETGTRVGEDLRKPRVPGPRKRVDWAQGIFWLVVMLVCWRMAGWI